MFEWFPQAEHGARTPERTLFAVSVGAMIVLGAVGGYVPARWTTLHNVAFSLSVAGMVYASRRKR